MYMFKRIIFTTILFIAIFVTPWWAVLMLSIIGIFHFNSYYEAIALGAFFDILYGLKGNISLGYGIIGFVAVNVSFLCIERMKREFR